MARYLFIPRPGPKSEHFKKGVEEGRVRPIQHDAATSRTLARMVEIEHRRARKEHELRQAAEAKAERIEGIESKLDEVRQLVQHQPMRSHREPAATPQDPGSEWISLKTIASELGITAAALRQMATNGAFPSCVKVTARHWVVERSTYETWLASRATNPQAEEIKNQRLAQVRKRAAQVVDVLLPDAARRRLRGRT